MLVTQKGERVECFSTVLELSWPLSTYKYPFVKFVFFVHYSRLDKQLLFVTPAPLKGE